MTTQADSSDDTTEPRLDTSSDCAAPISSSTKNNMDLQPAQSEATTSNGADLPQLKLSSSTSEPPSLATSQSLSASPLSSSLGIDILSLSSSINSPQPTSPTISTPSPLPLLIPASSLITTSNDESTASIYTYAAPTHPIKDKLQQISPKNIPMVPLPLTNNDNSFSLACYVETWSKVRDVSETINKAAKECLAGKGILVDIPKLEAEAGELLRLLKRASANSFVDDPNDTRKKLPPPLVRPRRHRRKKSADGGDEDSDTQDKKRKGTVMADLYCHSCGITDTPEWRRGPDGCKSYPRPTTYDRLAHLISLHITKMSVTDCSLCNACGLHYAKILKRETMVPNRQPQRGSMTMNNLLN